MHINESTAYALSLISSAKFNANEAYAYAQRRGMPDLPTSDVFRSTVRKLGLDKHWVRHPNKETTPSLPELVNPHSEQSTSRVLTSTIKALTKLDEVLAGTGLKFSGLPDIRFAMKGGEPHLVSTISISIPLGISQTAPTNSDSNSPRSSASRKSRTKPEKGLTVREAVRQEA